MNTAMQIMSIQHQLVLAVGNSNDLKEMLQQFLQVCSSRLDATHSHIFIFQDSDNNPTYQQPQNTLQLKHYLSFPQKKHGTAWSDNQQLATIVAQFSQTNQANEMIEFEKNLYYCFQIGDFGVLIITRKHPLAMTIQNALTPVLQKLENSCISSMVHQALLLEINTRKEIEKKIRYQASHDFLTGLYNRVEMQRRLSNAIQNCITGNQRGGLLLIDLVNFKNINDVMGHHVGDKVLQKISRRLKNIFTFPHTVGRFGGDEFIMLLTDLPADDSKVQSTMNGIIKHIITTIETPLEVPEGTFSLSCFIGYETFYNSNKTVHDIIRNANIAMYEAIKKRESKAVAYNRKMSDLLNERIHYTVEIENALKNNEFELHYQPQYDDMGAIIGAEALLRWNNPRRGYESPSIYIPIAEESDLILQIGDFVLKQACEDIAKLEQIKLPDSFKQISVNASAKQLAKNDFVDNIISAVQQSKIKPSRLKIEITESIMMGDIDLSISYLEKLRQFGVQCAIDDFGTGYSSLAYLRRLPASLLKIDRIFVTNIHQDEGNNAIASMIIELGKRLKMQVIAEGVENQQELNCLIELGCYQYQGYYFSRPLPFQELLNMLNSTN